MTRLIFRNLRYYWRTNLAVVAGVAIAVAVLSGALMMGSSVRDSLRGLLLQRLGATDVVVASDRFFRDDLAAALTASDNAGTTTNASLIRVQGVLVREGTSQRTRTVQVYGVDDRFWRFHRISQSGPAGRTALVGHPLAGALGIKPGDTLLLRIDTAGSVPRESLYGRRESTGRTIRLACGGVLAPHELGEFALQPSQGEVFAIFVPLARLQRDLAQPSRVNTVLVAGASGPADPERVRQALAKSFSLEDAGITVRPVPRGLGAIVESQRLLLDTASADAAFAAARDVEMPAGGVFSYLANTIRANGREIPYSVITAADVGRVALTDVRWIGLPRLPDGAASRDSLWLNEWAARELNAAPGDQAEIDYYRWTDDGRLATESTRFTVAGIVAIGGDIDGSLAPDVPGMSDARTMGDWDPPFPIDLRRIRPADEAYWEQHRATPKAFVTLERGRELWRTRFGDLSSVRVALPPWVPEYSADTTDRAPRVAAALRRHLTAEAAGFTVVPVRAQGLEASTGSTDFGEYFVYFSFFLMAAAVLLAALFFRLGVEQRVREIGTLQAVGFSAATIRRLFLAEGVVLSGAGSLLGLLGALAYGTFLIVGLRTWWVDAVGTRQIILHVSIRDLGLGTAAAVVTSLGAIVWTLRGLRHTSAHGLLAGALDSGAVGRPRGRTRGVVAAVAFPAAGALLAAAGVGAVPDVAGFFGAGVLLLIAMLSLVAIVLRRTPAHEIARPGWFGLARLGARYLTTRPGRSLLAVALIAFATFVIVSVEAFRRDGGASNHSASSGSGGFALVARAALPIFDDPNGDTGRDALGIGATEHAELARIRFVPFRERAGDDASCLNLYAPREPRILGASASFVREGRFSFQASLATTPAQERNPWLLLESAPSDGAIPAIADANTIQYILHRAVGDEIVVRGDNGAEVRLRLVAALRDSLLQGELIIAEAPFLRVFPDREGFNFFLMDVEAAQAESLVAPLEEALAPWGVVVELSANRLAAYHRVENTYLSTFQSLGVLGLILGTLGLAAVLLRNVLERRRELALLRAVGYRGGALAFVIVTENVLLMVGGLACGAVSALVAIGPALAARGGSLPLAAAGVMLAVVLIGGVLSSLVAVVAVWRMPLLASLRSE